MVFCALILRPRVNRIANIALSIMYALTIIAGAIGEWNYYILGSAIEATQLATIVCYAWTWPKETPPTSTTAPGATPHHIQPTAPKRIQNHDPAPPVSTPVSFRCSWAHLKRGAKGYVASLDEVRQP